MEYSVGIHAMKLNDAIVNVPLNGVTIVERVFTMSLNLCETRPVFDGEVMSQR